jgi:hypothetical protein
MTCWYIGPARSITASPSLLNVQTTCRLEDTIHRILSLKMATIQATSLQDELSTFIRPVVAQLRNTSNRPNMCLGFSKNYCICPLRLPVYAAIGFVIVGQIHPSTESNHTCRTGKKEFFFTCELL